MAYFDGSKWTWRGRPDAGGRWTQEPIAGDPSQFAGPNPKLGAATGSSARTPAHRSHRDGRLHLNVSPPAIQARWKTIFRIVLILPNAIALYGLNLAFAIVAVLMWFSALFTARVPYGMWRFNLGVLRFQARTTAYAFLLTEAYPPFSLEDPRYPVRLQLDGPPDRFNRLAVLFRAVLAIPALVVATLLYVGLVPFFVCAWLATIVTRHNPRAFHEACAAALRYMLRYNAWLYLLTTEYPKAPFGDSKSEGHGWGTMPLSPAGRKVAQGAVLIGALFYAAYVVALPTLVQINVKNQLTSFDTASLVGLSGSAEVEYENALGACDNSMPCVQRATSVLDHAVTTEISIIHDIDFPTAKTRQTAQVLANQLVRENVALQQAIALSTPSASLVAVQHAQAIENSTVAGLRQLGSEVGAVTTNTGTASTVVAPTTSGPSATLATNIGLQPQDLGTGFTATLPGSVLEHRSNPGRCTPLSSAPWLADVSSPQYSAGATGPIVYSTVVILPTANDARLSLRAVSAPTYGRSCYQPAFDAAYQLANEKVNESTPCDLSQGGSTISAIVPGSLADGISGWNYRATQHCAATNTTSIIYQEVLNQVVGRVFIQVNIRSLANPPTASWESQVMSTMIDRAQPLVASSTATVPSTSPPSTPAS
jgi:hypothetical protein